jgi:hypothetical protein
LLLSCSVVLTRNHTAAGIGDAGSCIRASPVSKLEMPLVYSAGSAEAEESPQEWTGSLSGGYGPCGRSPVHLGRQTPQRQLGV